jgi:hypothetical protein
VGKGQILTGGRLCPPGKLTFMFALDLYGKSWELILLEIEFDLRKCIQSYVKQHYTNYTKYANYVS